MALARLFPLHKFGFFWPGKPNADFNLSFAIVLPVADPDGAQFAPVVVDRLDREPRPGYEVGAFQSQTCPDVIQSHSFHRTAGNERWQIPFFKVEDVATVERNFGRR